MSAATETVAPMVVKGTVAKHETATTLGANPHLYPYVMQHINDTPVQINLRNAIAKEDMAVMMGAPDEAAFLGWLLALTGAKKVLEVGVFRGSSTLAFALALPADGKVVGLDISAEYAALGQAAWKEAGVESKIDFRLGDAVQSIAALEADPKEVGTYDMVFIDCDKVNYGRYYEAALVLLRVGGIIAVDNTLWDGEVVAPTSPEGAALAAINAKIREDKRVHATMLPIADGLYLCRKL